MVKCLRTKVDGVLPLRAKTTKNIWKHAKLLFTEDKKFTQKLDKMKSLFPIQGNQVVDLSTGQVSPRTRETPFTFESCVEYDGDLHADTPIADQYFKSLVGDDDELYEFLRLILGYCLTGETCGRKFFILHGPTASNGKTSLVKLLETLMGKTLFTTLDKKAITKTRGGGKTKARLQHARLAVASEFGSTDKLDQPFIKSWTGGDSLHLDNGESFETHAKLCLVTNQLPVFDVEQAMLDRIMVIPFPTRFVEQPSADHECKQDPQLVDDLMNKDLSQVFRWILPGAKRWYDQKKQFGEIPLAVREATKSYEIQMDSVNVWRTDRCTECDDKKKTPDRKTMFYSDYESWMKQKNQEKWTKPSKQFWRKLGWNIGIIDSQDHLRIILGLSQDHLRIILGSS
jgi:P4 family phage/plasmid primase-like protien